MPSTVRPMLCTLVKELKESEEYIYEVKWDGYRIIAFVNNRKVRLDSRNGLNYTAKFSPISEVLSAIDHNVIIDGEVVVFDEEGKPDFNALQNYKGEEGIQYCVFDLLWMDGHSLKELPLVERRELLQLLIRGKDFIKFSDSFENGSELYKQMVSMQLEGIVAKRLDSLYIEGNRSNLWIKIPTRVRQEFVIGGWVDSENGRSFKSLLFGAYANEKFMWIGRSGGGFKEKQMADILLKLKKIEVPNSPFKNKVLDLKGSVAHWVKPELVANFEFATWTKSGRIRKPAIFLGFRSDKKAEDVVREIPI